MLVVQALDGFGTRTLLPETPVRLLGPNPGGTSPYTMTLRLNDRSQRLVFTLREPESGAVI